jgi:hypothetical protein
MVKGEIAVFARDIPRARKEEGEAMNSRHRAAYPSGMSLAVLSTRVRTGMCEVGVVKRLLARDDCEPWPRAALECAVAGNPLDVSDALSNLAAAGVIHLSEERVALSRTARGLMCHLRSEVLPADAPCGANLVPARAGSCAGAYRFSAVSAGHRTTKEGITNAEK